MANGRRSIYSRRQAQAPGSYDTPLADFLDAIPGYITQYQQNQLQLSKQALQEKRYDDSVKRQQERDNRADYDRILSRLGKYDYANMKKVADQYGYEDDSMSFASMIENQSNTLSGLRDKINQVQNLGTEATYFDYDEIAKDISPQDIEMLSERDKFGYDTLVNSKKRFDTQRRTGMRAMPEEAKNRLKTIDNLLYTAEKDLMEEYKKLGFDIRSGDKIPKIQQDLIDAGQNIYAPVKSLQTSIKRYRADKDVINNQYKITEPVNELPGEEVPVLYGEGTGGMDQAITSNQLLKNLDLKPPDSPASALSQEEQVEAMYTLASATEDSDEYKKAQEMLGAFSELKETDIGTPKPPSGIFAGLRERLSVAGQEREQTGETGFGIDPGARAFKLPPKQDFTPEYFERVTDQAEQAISESGAEQRATAGGMQNPKDTQFYYGGDIDVAIAAENSKLAERDQTIKDAQTALKAMPKTKSYAEQIKRLTKLVKDNPLNQRWVRAKSGARLVKQSEDVQKIDEISRDILARFESKPEEQQETGSAVENLIRAIAPIRADAPSGVRVPQN